MAEAVSDARGPSNPDGRWSAPDVPGVASSTARLALLLQVSEALSLTNDPDEAVGRLARLIVPQLADWSFITVVGYDGILRDVGLAHRDPARIGDLQAYSDRHLANMTDNAAVAVSLRTGEPVIVPHLSEELLALFLPDPAVAYLTRRLDPHGVAVFPLTAGARTFGVLVSVTTTPRGSHTPDDLATLLEVSRRAGPVLAAARSARRARTVAETMQRSLLRVSPAGPGLQAAVHYRPAYADREVGGDWYDVFTLADGTTVASIGDVMGHDLAAIAAMAQLRSFMRANAWNSGHSPAHVLTATDSVSRGLGPGTMATALTLELAPPSPDGSVAVRWSNAGHPPPVILTTAGDAWFLGAQQQPDPPLGIAPNLKRTDHELLLQAGTLVILYTDGLVEHRSHSIDTRLIELAAQLKTLPVRDLDALLANLCTAMGIDETHDDDIALIAIRIANPDHTALSLPEPLALSRPSAEAPGQRDADRLANSGASTGGFLVHDDVSGGA